MSRAAAEIEPVSRTLSSSAAFPGPILAPDSNTMLSFTLGMAQYAPGAVIIQPVSLDCRNHLVLHPMNRSGTDTERFCRLEDSCHHCQLFTDSLDHIRAHRTATKPLPLTPRTPETRFDPLHDHAAL